MNSHPGVLFRTLLVTSILFPIILLISCSPDFIAPSDGIVITPASADYPVPGGNASLTFSDVKPGGDYLISWTAASDSDDGYNSLEYNVIGSSSNNISTIQDAIDNGQSYTAGWSKGITSWQFTGMGVNQKYFTVLVRDPKGNTASYEVREGAPLVTVTYNSTAPVINGELSYSGNSIEDVSATNSSIDLTISITNLGSGNLHVSALTADDPAAVFVKDNIPAFNKAQDIPVNGSVSFTVTFQGKNLLAGDYGLSFQLLSNDIDSSRGGGTFSTTLTMQK